MPIYGYHTLLLYQHILYSLLIIILDIKDCPSRQNSFFLLVVIYGTSAADMVKLITNVAWYKGVVLYFFLIKCVFFHVYAYT